MPENHDTDDEQPTYPAGEDPLTCAFPEIAAGFEYWRPDELTVRRELHRIYAAYAALTPAQVAVLDAELAEHTAAEVALVQGRAAFATGDLVLAESRLRIAAGYERGDAVAYLAALYHRQGRDELAAAWRTIARADGFTDHDIDRLTHEEMTR